MKPSVHLIALLTISWFVSAAAGALIALYIRPAILPPTLRLHQLEIIDAKGVPRITLELQNGQPSLHLDTASQVPIIQLAAHEYTLPPAKETLIEAILDLNDQDGKPTISLFGRSDHRGMLAFSSAAREGKVILGNFGITDDGTDTTLWGMRVSGPNGTGSQLGMLAVNGKDTGLVWPGFPSPFHK